MKAFVIILSLVLISCATTHVGKLGKPMSKDSQIPLALSGRALEDSGSKSFQLFEFTLENTSDDWLKIASAEVILGDVSKNKLSVVVGKDLKDWAEAMAFKKKKDEHNEAVAQSVLLGAGAVAAASAGDNNPNLAAAGAVLALGSLAWIAADVLQDSYRWSVGTSKVPETHLHNSSNIPGKMFLRRWVLINKPTDTKISSLPVVIETIDGRKETYEVPFWQKKERGEY